MNYRSSNIEQTGVGNENMKILHIIPCYKPAYVYAGVIESVSRLCEALVEGGQSVDVYTTTANGKRELDVKPGVRLDVDGVQVIYFKRITKDPTHASPALWMHLWRNVRKYDVVHIHSWWNVLVIVSAWICILRRTKIIISPRGMLTSYIFNSTRVRVKKLIHTLLGQQALAHSVLHATAPSEYEECTRLIKGWKGFVLPNILALSSIDIHREENDCFTLLFLSRIHPKKGLELLFQALAEVPFDFRLKIGGSGDESYVNELKTLAQRLSITDKVQWLGWLGREEKFKELMRSDCFVLTSYNENFANVVIEALHVGTPVFISEEVGLAPFVREHDLGWVTPLDVQAIRTSITCAYEDKPKRDVINRKSPEVIKESFWQPALIKQYVENYNRWNNY